MITLHSLTPSSSRRSYKRVGRGNSSGKGTTAGRGTKGQRARTGGRNKANRRSLKALFERTPKLRGFQSIHPKYTVVDLQALSQRFDGTKIITPEMLVSLGMIARYRRGVKIVGSMTGAKKLTVKAHAFTVGAKAALEKAGGQAILIVSKKTKKS